ncbi:lysophospholipid acyltransferase family protein [Sagittula sp. S175]|uniref:lysophospholipid acyltransferase family protein n=1 Tax=Sagittula sp. S175 TaxID=3415129 RepID=UPI003C7DB40A
MNYYDFLETPVGRTLHKMPFQTLRRAMSTAGRFGLVKDCDFVADVMEATGVANGREAKRLAAEVDAAQAGVYADLGLMMHGKWDRVQRHLIDRVEVEGREILEALRGKPYMIISAHFASFYLGALMPGLFDPVTIIRRFHSEGRDALMERLCSQTGQDLEVIGLTDPSVGPKIISRVRKGRPVAAMIDYFYEDTSLFLAPFMGREAATPAGIPSIAVRMKLPLVPVIVLRTADGGYRVTISEPLRAPDEGDQTERTFALACAMNGWLETQVRAHPEQWTFWPSLPRRWSYAESFDEHEQVEPAVAGEATVA